LTTAAARHHDLSRPAGLNAHGRGVDPSYREGPARAMANRQLSPSAVGIGHACEASLTNAWQPRQAPVGRVDRIDIAARVVDLGNGQRRHVVRTRQVALGAVGQVAGFKARC